jgi:hypothetical protein
VQPRYNGLTFRHISTVEVTSSVSFIRNYCTYLNQSPNGDGVNSITYTFQDNVATSTVSGWAMAWSVEALIVLSNDTYPASRGNSIGIESTAYPASVPTASTPSATANTPSTTAIPKLSSTSNSRTGLNIGLGVGLGLLFLLSVALIILAWRLKKRRGPKEALSGVSADELRGVSWGRAELPHEPITHGEEHEMEGSLGSALKKTLVYELPAGEQAKELASK